MNQAMRCARYRFRIPTLKRGVRVFVGHLGKEGLVVGSQFIRFEDGGEEVLLSVKLDCGYVAEVAPQSWGYGSVPNVVLASGFPAQPQGGPTDD